MADDGAAGENGGLLEEGSVDVGRSVSAETILLGVADDADDNARPVFINGIRVVAEKDLAADRVFVGEEAVHKGFIDDDGPGRCDGIMCVEIAAALERNFQCLK